jgi:large subunit ribosomal protein L10
MSKYVKDLISKQIAQQLDGVQDALLVNVIGLDANSAVVLRKELREKNIRLLVVKNSMAKRASEGTPLAPAFDGIEGTNAIVWGSDDIVSLAKEVTKYGDDVKFGAFRATGGVMDGEHLTAERVKEVSKWPSRGEQLSILVGQILSPGANLSAALLGPGATLASQVEQKSKGDEGDVEEESDGGNEGESES